MSEATEEQKQKAHEIVDDYFGYPGASSGRPALVKRIAHSLAEAATQLPADVEAEVSAIEKMYGGTKPPWFGEHHAFVQVATDVDRLISIIRAGLGDWRLISTAPKYEPIWLFGTSLVNSDFNPKGIVEGYWFDDLGWVGAVWNNEQDCWDAVQVKPTHWRPFPDPPITCIGATPSVDDETKEQL